MMSATSHGREDLLELFLRYGAAEESDRCRVGGILIGHEERRPSRLLKGGSQ
jgi:hypothetical protein